MAKGFSFSSYLVPAKSRAKSLQGASVSGNIVANVSNVGVKTETAATVVNNYITNNYIEQSTEGQIKGDPITITDLLALTDMHELDFYQVFNSGSESSGWVFGDKFTLNDQEYDSGSFVQYTAAGWQKMDDDIVDLSNHSIFNPLQKNLYLVEGLFSESSYNQLQGVGYDGLKIARLCKYELDGDNIYQPKWTAGADGEKSYQHIISVPYAHVEGDTYKGGLLSAADYETLMQGGGIAGLTIDTTFVNMTPSDSNVPSSKLTYDSLSTLGSLVSGLYSAKANVDDLALYVKTSAFNAELANNYYTKSVIDTAFASLPKSASDIENLGFAKKSDYIVYSNIDTTYNLVGSSDGITSLHGGGTPLRFYVKINGVTDAASFMNYFKRVRISAQMTSNTGTPTLTNISNITTTWSSYSGTECVEIMVNASYQSGTTGNPTYCMITFDKIW